MQMDVAARRVARAVAVRSAEFSQYSESELWAVILHRWKHKRAGSRVYELMTGVDGRFHPGRASDVVAAALTARGVRLSDDGALDAGDLATFLDSQAP